MRVIRTSDLQLRPVLILGPHVLQLCNKYGEGVYVKAPFILRVNGEERYYVSTDDADGKSWFIQPTQNSTSNEALKTLSDTLKIAIKLRLETLNE